MTRDEYIAQVSERRAEALQWFAQRTPMHGEKADRFHAVIGGLQYELEVLGVCPVNRTAVGRTLNGIAAVPVGELVHFSNNSMSLVPRR